MVTNDDFFVAMFNIEMLKTFDKKALDFDWHQLFEIKYVRDYYFNSGQKGHFEIFVTCGQDVRKLEKEFLTEKGAQDYIDELINFVKQALITE